MQQRKMDLVRRSDEVGQLQSAKMGALWMQLGQAISLAEMGATRVDRWCPVMHDGGRHGDRDGGRGSGRDGGRCSARDGFDGSG
jgi:uncharacterized membrane protein YgcG